MPNKNLKKLLGYFNIVAIEKITIGSLEGPTDDFEDNLQLLSAAISECDYFLTNDKNLLSMRYFGKTQLTDFISNP